MKHLSISDLKVGEYYIVDIYNKKEQYSDDLIKISNEIVKVLIISSNRVVIVEDLLGNPITIQTSGITKKLEGKLLDTYIWSRSVNFLYYESFSCADCTFSEITYNNVHPILEKGLNDAEIRFNKNLEALNNLENSYKSLEKVNNVIQTIANKLKENEK